MSNKISRRNFLHTAGLGTLGAAAAGLLTACGDKAASGSVASSAAAAGTYTAGTYSATATGINTTTPVTVTMTFSADAITDVQIDVANETKGYGADIADEMVKKILDAQSSEVDGHSGATITSGAIKKAAESCINQAKGVAVAPTEASKAETVVPDGLTTEEVESSVVELGDITPDETKDFDVVVVGAGAAGVPAAGWAAELGGHVALLQEQKTLSAQLEKRSMALKNLYLDKVSGVLSEGQFVELNQDFLEEKSRLERRLAQIDQELSGQEQPRNQEEVMAKARELLELKTLPRELAVMLIEKIEIGEQDQETGRQEVKIHWKF